MTAELERMLRGVREAAEEAEAQDLADTRHYALLKRKERWLRRAIRHWKRLERRTEGEAYD